jgi:hypothetical protein
LLLHLRHYLASSSGAAIRASGIDANLQSLALYIEIGAKDKKLIGI